MLNVSANKRFLVNDDGTPFFYLGDTAWELFHRLNREDAAFYLEDRVSKGTFHVRATRDADGSYALVYVPYYAPVTVDLTRLTGETVVAHWFSPRNGTMRRIGSQPRTGQTTFTPPAGGPDWVLILEG